MIDLFGDHDPGKHKLIALKPGVTAGPSIFGGAREEYRYTLSRHWDDELPAIMFLMMNPSVATEDGDDKTVAKTQVMARRWGYGTVYVGNSFAYRAQNPLHLLRAADPVGPDNDFHLQHMIRKSALVVLAYGTPPYPKLWPRGDEVSALVRSEGKVPHVLRLSKKRGRPEHPLYLGQECVPVALPDAP